MSTGSRIKTGLAAAVLAAAAACTVHQSNTPTLSGPSTVGLSIGITANPDSITQDGSSRSTILITAFDSNGHPLAGQTVRLDILSGGQPVDFGTLSTRNATTGSDGTVSVIFTAPPPPPSNLTTQANCPAGIFSPGLPGPCVQIVVTPIGTGFANNPSQSVSIHLVAPGVILAPADTPTPVFTISPPPTTLNVNSTFDASLSCPAAADAAGNCIITATGAKAITNYAWNFGDGGSANGKIQTHSFSSPGTFSVTVTVTNDRNVSASKTQSVTLISGAGPTGDWTFSPTQPAVGDSVFFSADGVIPPPGRTLVQYSWNFGDGTPNASGVNPPPHQFLLAGTYNVSLSVLDDAGQRSVITHLVSVSSGNPTVVISFSPTTPHSGNLVSFNGTGSTTSGGVAIQSYAWDFGDPTSGGANTQTGSNPTHTFTNLTTTPYTVRLTVTDVKGRIGTSTITVTVLNP